MVSGPILETNGDRADAATHRDCASRGWTGRAGAWLLHELRQALPPTVYFLVGFNVIVLTTNLIVAQYNVAVSSFALATVGALLVGKAVVVVNTLPLIRRYGRAPLIQLILYKTVIYWLAVILVRVVERFAQFSIVEGNAPGSFPSHLLHEFSWTRFGAISIWVFILFLTYETAWEFSQLFAPGEIRRFLFMRNPSRLQLTAVNPTASAP